MGRNMSMSVGEESDGGYSTPTKTRKSPRDNKSSVSNYRICFLVGTIFVLGFFLGSIFMDASIEIKLTTSAGDVEDKKTTIDKPARVRSTSDLSLTTDLVSTTEVAIGTGGSSAADEENVPVVTSTAADAKLDTAPITVTDLAMNPDLATSTDLTTGTTGGSDSNSVGVSEVEREELPPGFKKPASYYSDTYLPRGPTLDDTKRRSLADKWGEWTFQDPNPDVRPRDDFYAAYPNRDVPFAKFPETAWQKDPAYLEGFLEQSSALVDRAMEAILAEYGHSAADEPNKTFEERSAMFSLREYDMEGGAKGPGRRTVYQDGGWTTKASSQMFVKRVMHAVMTEDNFVFVMGGHSSAAGHGNHFQQSYTLQLQQHLEPVMARLGVAFTAHNFAMGGLGTIHNALGMGDLYGKDIDVLRWDSGMTEGNDDLFQRQGLMSGNKVPALWGGKYETLKHYHSNTGIEVGDSGQWAACWSGIPVTEDPVQVHDLPFAAQYLQCSKEMTSVCRKEGYNGVCWIDRDDVPAPPSAGNGMGGRAKWHPGNKIHELNGKALTFTILRALKEGLRQWKHAPGYQLPDDAWHMTGHYESVRSRFRLMADDTPCFQMNLPDYVCKYPLHSRSEFTPRFNPAATSIRSLLPAETSAYASLQPQPNYYDPPDAHNPALLDVPEGSVDYMAIVENGIDFAPNRFRPRVLERPQWKNPKQQQQQQRQALSAFSNNNNNIKLGLGWSLNAPAAADNCDGTYDSFCSRAADSPCMLYGHNDRRGGLLFDGYSGWQVMKLENIQRGLIMIMMREMDKKHQESNPATEGWLCENNQDCTASILEGGATGTDDDCWRFQFAINGQITEWDRDEFKAQRRGIAHAVEIFVLMDDPNVTAASAAGSDGGAAVDVEVAIRLKACGSDARKGYSLSHVYWA